jgi:uncharacterized protein YerC
MARSKEQRLEAIALLKQGVSVGEVFKKTGVPEKTIYNWGKKEDIDIKELTQERILKRKTDRLNIKRQKERGPRGPRKKEERESALKFLSQGKTLDVVHKITGVPTNTLCRWKAEAGMKGREQRGPRGYRSTEKYGQMIELLKQGVSVAKIKDKVGVSRNTIGRYAKKEGINIKTNKDDENMMNELVKRLKQAIKNRNFEAIKLLIKGIEEMLSETDLEQQEILEDMLRVAREIISERKNEKGSKENELDR